MDPAPLSARKNVISVVSMGDSPAPLCSLPSEQIQDLGGTILTEKQLPSREVS